MTTSLALAALYSVVPAHAACALNVELLRIGGQCARIKYDVHGSDQQMKHLRALERQAAQLVRRYPGRARPLLWQGVIASEEAAKASLLHKLDYARKARRLLDAAKAINPNAAHGGVWLSLGVLYYRVPGFPIGFGNDSKASACLLHALALDPDGLDANYFYGDFLFEQGRYVRARAVLEHGLKAPVDPQRPIWDKGRRLEIRALIAKIARKESE